MDPLIILKESIGSDRLAEAGQSWIDQINEITDELPVFSSRVFMIRGGRKTFDFPVLPSGSLGYWCANGREAWPILADGTGLDKLLSGSWPKLSDADPVKLASFILRFNGQGIRYGHSVLRDVNHLSTVNNGRIGSDGYRLNDRELRKTNGELTEYLSVDDDLVVISALTLMGWMHDKRNLGVETIQITRDGKVRYEKRRVISKKIYKSIPAIKY